MQKLEKLTDEQIKLMEVVKTEWIKFCLGGDTSIDRKIAADGIRWIYGKAKLKSPFVIFVNGPLQCQYAVWFLKAWIKNKKSLDQIWDQVWNQVRNQIWDQVGDQVREQVGDQVWNQVRNQVREQVWNQVRNQIWNQVGDQVREQVWNQVRDQVRDQVGDQVRNQIWDQVGDQVREQVWNQVWNQVRNQVREQVWNQVKKMDKEFFDYSWNDLSNSSWLSFYDCFDRLGIKVTDDFKRFRDYTKSGIFMTIFLNGFAICCPRPTSVKRNIQNRLHNESGPAIMWEGENYYFLNGIRVPEWLVITDAGKIDPKLALTEKNVDVQREIIRKVGAERMLKVCKAKTLDKFVDTHTKGGNEYKLMEMKIGDINRKYLYFEHASFPGVFYAQPVHPDLKKAIHARAWMLGIGEADELARKNDEEIKRCLPVEVA